jgi:hypothetical protein
MPSLLPNWVDVHHNPIHQHHGPIGQASYPRIDQLDYGIHELDVQFINTIIVLPNPRIDGYHTTARATETVEALVGWPISELQRFFSLRNRK